MGVTHAEVRQWGPAGQHGLLGRDRKSGRDANTDPQGKSHAINGYSGRQTTEVCNQQRTFENRANPRLYLWGREGSNTLRLPDLA
jgi:hypothetical protein